MLSWENFAMQAQSKIEFELSEYVPLIKEVIESGGEFRLFPRGTSMLPLLRQGKDSVILVKPGQKLKKRDIIFYKRPNGQFVLHRIVKAPKNQEYVLCGDNQTALEKGVTDSMVIAVVSAVYRAEKRIEKSRLSRRFYELVWCLMPFRRVWFFARRKMAGIKRIFIK